MFTHKPVILFTTANLAEIFKVASPEVANEIVVLLNNKAINGQAILNQSHSSLDMELLSKDQLKFLDELKAAFAGLQDNSFLENVNLCSEIVLPPSGQDLRCSLIPPDEEEVIPRKRKPRKTRTRKSRSKFVDHSKITVDEEENNNLSRFIPRDVNGRRTAFSPTTWDSTSAKIVLRVWAAIEEAEPGLGAKDKDKYERVTCTANKLMQSQDYSRPLTVRAVKSFLSTIGATGERKNRKSSWSTEEDHALLDFYSSHGRVEDLDKLRKKAPLRSDAAITTRLRIVDLLLNVIAFEGVRVGKGSPRLLSLVNSLYTAKILPSLLMDKPFNKDDLYSFWK